jgi:hypothetical protein
LTTSEGGLLRIKELLELPFSTISSSQLTTVITNQLLPFFRIFTYSDVVGSIFLRTKVITVYNITYTGDGTGQRAVSLFATLAKHLSNHDALSTSHECIEFNTGFMDLIETVLATFWNLVDVKTLAHSVPGFVRIAETFAALFADVPERISYHTSKAKAHLEKLNRRIGISQTISEVNGIQKLLGRLASFQLVREMPGELSNKVPDMTTIMHTSGKSLFYQFYKRFKAIETSIFLS